ncbi:MAG: macro domain-containing protein [Clostridia bacterium]|nr:macro domain-containing protein [Clostridia bacterium]
MPYQIVRNDITQMHVDAIVNPTDPVYSGLGGTDAQIHRIAGSKLRRACDRLPRLEQGQTAVTKGYQLPCRYVIHTVGPVWHDGTQGEKEKLYTCYQNALAAAAQHRCKTAAFPLIASGTFGYPKDQVLRIALEAIGDFLMTHDMTVYIVVYDKESYAVSKKLQADVQSYIDEHYFDLSHTLANHIAPARSETLSSDALPMWNREDYETTTLLWAEQDKKEEPIAPPPFPEPSSPLAAEKAPAPKAAKKQSLDQLLSELDEGFSQTLLKLIDERGMTDVQCYKRANIDKKLFSKIRSNPHYQPSKPTVIAFAVALKLSLADTKMLLERAGLALSHSSRFDVIVEYFLDTQQYDLMEINEVLYQYDLPCLGNVTA